MLISLRAVFVLCAISIVAGCGGSSGETSTTPRTLAPGTTWTMTANSSVLVPSGTIVGTNTINGSLDTIIVSVGTVVTVPVSATGPANDTITTIQSSGSANFAYKAISAGSGIAGGTTCAITTTGGVRCWGSNIFGQLGNGTGRDSSIPVDVTDLTSGVAAISTAYDFSCALTTAGGVKCWGANGNGQLGNGTTNGSSVPVDVTGLTSGVTTLSARGGFACALTSGGGVKCWGENTVGQLGNGTTTRSTIPVDVTGLSSGVSAISTGIGFACAVMTDGGARCWGANENGQLGNGATTNSSIPVEVAGLSSGVATISNGDGFSCALMIAGGIQCWGANVNGQLGNGSDINSSVPVAVSGLSSGVIAISAGGYSAGAFACALTTFGGVKCWGYNGSGELGTDAFTYNSAVPVDVSGLSSGVAAISTGGGIRGNFACALTTTGTVKCWGDNTSGELGNGTVAESPMPVAVPELSSGIAAISAGSAKGSVCALTAAGAVECWGANLRGELGDGTTTGSSTPVTVTGLSSGVAAVSTGGGFACALTTAGSTQCWGANSNGQLGNGTTTDFSIPVAVTGLSNGVAAISSGSRFACALTTAGGAQCWGANAYGQLGNGTTTDSSIPVDVTGLSNGVLAIAAGQDFACALITSGGIECWGYNGTGQLGNGTTINSSIPVGVVGLTTGVAALSAGENLGGGFACALTTAGGVKCWGRNDFGELGNNTYTDSSIPVNVTGLSSGVAAISAGNLSACAQTTSGGIKCWGYNGSGGLGNGTNGVLFAPVEVTGLSNGIAAISTGAGFACALTILGGVECWGANGNGQLGNGYAITDSPVPEELSSPSGS